MTPPAVRLAAEECGIAVLQPETLRDDSVIDRLLLERPDVLVVVAYGELLGSDVLDLAPHGALNVHPSLLPRYRGAAPIPAAILAGDGVTGISIIKLVRQLDAGPVVAQKSIPLVGRETAGELSNRLAEEAAAMLPDVVVDWVNGQLAPIPQDESQASYVREWSRDDARIDWEKPAAEIERLVRAANPWPVAWTMMEGESLRILNCEVGEQEVTGVPGTVVKAGKQILVATGDRSLILKIVQPAGRKPMDALSWWNGLRQTELVFGF